MVAAGFVVGAHGVGGAIKLALDLPWSALATPPATLVLTLADAAWRRLQAQDAGLAARAERTGDGWCLRAQVEQAHPTPNGARVTLAGLTVREVAATLKGARVALPRACLPPCAPGEFWCFELEGMAALDEAGRVLGRIRAVTDMGAQTLATLVGVDGREAWVPVVSDVVRRVARAEGTVVLRLPEGLWEMTAQ